MKTLNDKDGGPIYHVKRELHGRLRGREDSSSEVAVEPDNFCFSDRPALCVVFVPTPTTLPFALAAMTEARSLGYTGGSDESTGSYLAKGTGLPSVLVLTVLTQEANTAVSSAQPTWLHRTSASFIAPVFESMKASLKKRRAEGMVKQGWREQRTTGRYLKGYV